MAILGQKGGTEGLPNIFFAKSTTWTPEIDFECYVWVIGGGASGAAISSDVNQSVTGGSAGGTAISRLHLKASTAYTVTVGDGGAAIYGDNATAGNDGGNSVFSGSGITTMTANGGDAGTVSSGAAGVTGPSGGTSTGGNIANYDGGDGMSTTATKQTTGGGAVGLWSDGNKGTHVAKTSSFFIADGGSLYGGQIQSTANMDNANLDNGMLEAMGYPIVGSPFPEISASTYNDARAYLSSTNYEQGLTPIGSGHQPSNPSGKDWVTASDNFGMSPVGPFMGGNGFYSSASGTSNAFAGSATLGGGGGGCFTASGYGYSGRGGKGCVMVYPISMG
jgi:hypothetical protein